MKNFFYLLITTCLVSFSGSLQAQGESAMRPSPPAKASAAIGDLQVTIDYSQPSVKGRTIWGMLVPYGRVWRTGANEATTFQVNQDVLIEGAKLPAGKYALFSIPDKDKWTFIFNKNPDQWGAYGYDEAADALRVETEPGKATTFTERMTFEVDEETGHILLNWENISVGFEVKPTE